MIGYRYHVPRFLINSGRLPIEIVNVLARSDNAKAKAMRKYAMSGPQCREVTGGYLNVARIPPPPPQIAGLTLSMLD